MDKATLLAEVISQVKQLKKNATRAIEGLNIPLDSNEIKVKNHENTSNGPFSFRASLCCDYWPDLLFDLRQDINDLPLHLMKAKISTLGSRAKNVCFFTSGGEKNGIVEARELISCVHKALSNIIVKASTSAKYA